MERSPLLTLLSVICGWKNIPKVTIQVTHKHRIGVLFSKQNNESQDWRQIHCVLLYLILVCWMSFLSQCLNGLLPEAVAVSPMITSTFFCTIYASPHLSLLFYSFCLTHLLPLPPGWGKTLHRLTDKLLQKRMFRSSLTLERRNATRKYLGSVSGFDDWFWGGGWSRRGNHT